MNLQVTIDGRALVGNRTGIGVHTAEIAQRLGVDAPLIASHAVIEDRSGLDRCRFRVDPVPLGVAWQQLVLPRIADRGVLWAPHGTLPLALRIPSVATLHDFSSLTMPFRHRVKTVLSFNAFIGRSLQMATRIAAVSRAVAEEAVRWFAVARNRIEIVPNGVDDFFTPDADDGETGPGYVLFVGTIEPRKGLDDLLAVWESLSPSRPRLVLCGDAGWGSLALPRGAEITGYVDRTTLRDLYRGARAFVYPSRYEGFGIPPLEAMACGAPVIATRTGAVPEYAAGAALLVDPGDRTGLRDALVHLLRDDALRAELRVRGVERARTYTWERSAALMTQLLAEAVR